MGARDGSSTRVVNMGLMRIHQALWLLTPDIWAEGRRLVLTILDNTQCEQNLEINQNPILMKLGMHFSSTIYICSINETRSDIVKNKLVSSQELTTLLIYWYICPEAFGYWNLKFYQNKSVCSIALYVNFICKFYFHWSNYIVFPEKVVMTLNTQHVNFLNFNNI